MTRAFALSFLFACTSLAVGAAQQQPPFYYPTPDSSAVRVTRGVRFATADTLSLAMDIYRPARAAGPSAKKLPALIFFAGYWTAEGPPTRIANEWIKTWARVAAANGLIGIIGDMRAEPGTGNANTPARMLGDDFQRLTNYLDKHADEYGIDRERIAVFAASGASWPALAAIEDPRQTVVRAAVIYYGAGNVTQFRVDLPVLFVRAGLDSRGLNTDLAKTVALAVSQNAPVTVLNHHIGHHGFEARDNAPVTRQIIDQTIDFVKRATDSTFQSAIRGSALVAQAAGQMFEGKYHDAAQTYAELARRHPSNGGIRFTYGQVLLADKQYAAACDELRNLEPVSFDAILPTTRSCVLAGNVDSAVTWLQSIRKDWLRSDYVVALRRDSVFAPLWSRVEFQSLFQP